MERGSGRGEDCTGDKIIQSVKVKNLVCEED